MNFNEESIQTDSALSSYIIEYHKFQIDIILKSTSIDKYLDFYINISHLIEIKPEYFSIFYKNPIKLIMTLKKSVSECQKKYFDEEFRSELKEKELISIRLTHIPYCLEFYKSSINEIDETNIDCFLIVTATVLRVGSRKSLEKQKIFKCSQCNCEYTAFSDPQNYNKLTLPLKCNNVVKRIKKPNMITKLIEQIKHKKDQGKTEKSNENTLKEEMCNNKKFDPIEQTQLWVDYQEIKVQETFKTLKPGTIPKSLWVICENTLVDICKPGSDVIISGVLIKRWGKLIPNDRPELNICVYANNITLLNKENKTKKTIHKLISNQDHFEYLWLNCDSNLSDQLLLRNSIIRSICPKIYEKYDIKLALLLCIIGGVTHTVETTRIRGQCHLLLVGEPGTGKSQFLQFAQKLSSRAVFTNGIGTTTAGLTIAFVRENGEWMIEAGALVLSDLGICCIDEFNLIKNSDYVAVHEVMEQQTISASKAGITTKVNARTSIIACCNPVTGGQKYDAEKTLAENSSLTTPLISRFDLIFIVVDEKNSELDERNSEFVLKSFRNDENQNEFDEANGNIFHHEQIKEYIKIVQEKFEPIMTFEAEDLITQYYKNLRKIDMKGRNTIRTLESLARLSQAHARLMFKDKVEIFDVISIICLMESAGNSGVFDNIEIDFSNYIMLNEEKFEEIKEILYEKLFY